MSQNYESSRLLAELERLVKGSNMVAALSSYVDDPDYIGLFQEFDQVIMLELLTWEVNLVVRLLSSAGAAVLIRNRIKYRHNIGCRLY